MKTLKEYDRYVIRSHGSDNGVVMNFCPFCGRSINKRWTTAHGRQPARSSR